jgi:hypothetical protein
MDKVTKLYGPPTLIEAEEALSYLDPGCCRDTWQSVQAHNTDGPDVTIKTLFKLARDAGYQPSNDGDFQPQQTPHPLFSHAFGSESLNNCKAQAFLSVQKNLQLKYKFLTQYTAIKLPKLYVNQNSSFRRVD